MSEEAKKENKEQEEPVETSEKTEAQEPEKKEPEERKVEKKEPEKQPEEKPEEKKSEEKKPEEKKADKTEELEKQIEDLTGQVAKLKNAYAMAYADTENIKKRLNKEFDDYMKYHVKDFALEVLPVLDNCERALQVKPADTADENYRKAFEMVLRQLTNALKKEGVEEIECEGMEFDPNWMQAVMTEHKEDVKPGVVTQVLQKGYKLKDRLLRAAMVKVSE